MSFLRISQRPRFGFDVINCTNKRKRFYYTQNVCLEALATRSIPALVELLTRFYFTEMLLLFEANLPLNEKNTHSSFLRPFLTSPLKIGCEMCSCASPFASCWRCAVLLYYLWFHFDSVGMLYHFHFPAESAHTYTHT